MWSSLGSALDVAAPAADDHLPVPALDPDLAALQLRVQIEELERRRALNTLLRRYLALETRTA